MIFSWHITLFRFAANLLWFAKTDISGKNVLDTLVLKGEVHMLVSVYEITPHSVPHVSPRGGNSHHQRLHDVPTDMCAV